MIRDPSTILRASATRPRAAPQGVARLLQMQRGHGNRFVQRALMAAVAKPPCVCGGTCPACQAKRGAAQEEAARVVQAPGRPLDPATRVAMEAAFGRDFGAVRVHTDAPAAASAGAMNALAYTVGSSIVFGADQFAPQSASG